MSDSAELNKKKCTPCSGNTPKIDTNGIIKNLKKLDNWELNDNKEMIFKKFKFNNFKQSINFINKISLIAEQEGHHPDISFGYGYCIVLIHTHAIKGLSINDFILASKIDKID